MGHALCTLGITTVSVLVPWRILQQFLERGCVTFFRDGSGGLAEEFVDRIEVEHVVDTTGAGDSFAGGLAYGYLAYRDYVVACQYGNAMGAQRVTGTDLNVYLSREETERQILAAYGPRS